MECIKTIVIIVKGKSKRIAVINLSTLMKAIFTAVSIMIM